MVDHCLIEFGEIPLLMHGSIPLRLRVPIYRASPIESSRLLQRKASRMSDAGPGMTTGTGVIKSREVGPVVRLMLHPLCWLTRTARESRARTVVNTKMDGGIRDRLDMYFAVLQKHKTHPRECTACLEVSNEPARTTKTRTTTGLVRRDYPLKTTQSALTEYFSG